MRYLPAAITILAVAVLILASCAPVPVATEQRSEELIGTVVGPVPKPDSTVNHAIGGALIGKALGFGYATGALVGAASASSACVVPVTVKEARMSIRIPNDQCLTLNTGDAVRIIHTQQIRSGKVWSESYQFVPGPIPSK